MTVSFYLSNLPPDGVFVLAVNVANTNARALLAALGLPTDDENMVGDIEAADLRFRISMADPASMTRPSRDDHGVSLDANGVGATVRSIDYGLDLDRFRSYFERLLALADAAEAANLKIFWA